MRGTIGVKAEIKQLEQVIGKRLYILRIQNGMKLETVAAFSGVSYQTISNYEQGKCRMSVGTLCKIAESMKIPVVAFFPANGEVLKLETMVKLEAELVHCFRKIKRNDQERWLEMIRFQSNSSDMTEKSGRRQLEMQIISKL